MSTPNKDIEKVEVRVKWDPSAAGEPANDLDIAWDLFSGASRDAYRAALGVL